MPPPPAPPGPTILELWKWVRGDTPTVAFERWLYARPELERELGADLYHAAISTDFSSAEARRAVARSLADHARAHSSSACFCVRLKDLDVVDMGAFQAPAPAFEPDREWTSDEILGAWERVAEAGPPRW